MTSSSEHTPTDSLSAIPSPLMVGARHPTHAHNSLALTSTAPHLEPLTGNAQLPTNRSKIPEDMASSSLQRHQHYISGNHQSTTVGARPYPETHAWPSMPICPPRPVPSVPYEPSSRMAAIRDSVYEALFTRSYFYDFNPARIPLRETSPEIHDRMYDLHFQRVAVEEDLTHMLLDQTPDGTPIDPKLFNETQNQHLDTLVNTINRAMYTIYAQFLDMDPSLSCKAPPNNNMPPERGRLPHTFGKFRSPGSYIDSGTAYVTSPAHTIIKAAQAQRGTLTTDAPTATRQASKRILAALSVSMPTPPSNFRRTNTNDLQHLAPSPVVPKPFAQLSPSPRSTPAPATPSISTDRLPSSHDITSPTQPATIRDKVTRPAHSPTLNPPRVSLSRESHRAHPRLPGL
jgi:hypothetical protein